MHRFRFDDIEVRASMGDDGQPWFIANDVCKALGLANVTRAVAGLDDDEKGFTSSQTLGGDQQVVTINEPGLYSLVLRSRRPEAKRFKRWITHDVLPAIRKTGTYSIPRQRAPEAAELDLPGNYIAALERLVVAEKAKLELAAENVKQQELIDELTPAALAWKVFASGEGTIDVATFSKRLANSSIKIGPRVMFRKMAEVKWAYRVGEGKQGRWVAYAEHVLNGHLTMKAQSRPRYNADREVVGRKAAHDQLRLTRKGAEDLLVLLTRETFAKSGQLELLP